MPRTRRRSGGARLNRFRSQDLDSLVRAGTFLRDLDDLVIAIIGMGARHAELVGLAKLLEVDAVRFLYYQPRDVLPLEELCP